MATVSAEVLSSATGPSGQAKPPLPSVTVKPSFGRSRRKIRGFPPSSLRVRPCRGRALGAVSVLAMTTSSSGGSRCRCPSIPVSITTSTGPPVMIRCSTLSRRMRMSLRWPSTACALDHAEPAFAPLRKPDPLRPGQHEGLEGPGDERDHREGEQKGGDREKDAVGVRHRGHVGFLGGRAAPSEPAAKTW